MAREYEGFALMVTPEKGVDRLGRRFDGYRGYAKKDGKAVSGGAVFRAPEAAIDEMTAIVDMLIANPGCAGIVGFR